LELATRIAVGGADRDALQWLQQAFSGWFQSDGSLPLERFLGLPNTSGRLRRARRDAWLRAAATCIHGRGDRYALATELAHELDVFISRGGWAQWRDLAEPPSSATPLRCALWQFAKLNKGESLSAMHVHRILRGGSTDFPSEMCEEPPDDEVLAPDGRAPSTGDDQCLPMCPNSR
jgi:hypothetical protein